MKLASAAAVTDPRLGLDVERLFSGDPDILQAAAQIDRSLIQLALARPLRERLSAGFREQRVRIDVDLRQLFEMLPFALVRQNRENLSYAATVFSAKAWICAALAGFFPARYKAVCAKISSGVRLMKARRHTTLQFGTYTII